LKGLSHVLEDIEDVLSEEELDPRRDDNMRGILTACHSLFNDIALFVDKNSVVESKQSTTSSKARRVWKRLKWDPNDVNELRARISSQVAVLHAFVSNITT
jgi:hypothetical protein